MRAVDTNVLVRLITRDDKEQLAAAEAFVSSGGWVSHLVLAELTWVLSSVYELTQHQIATVVEMLLDHTELVLHEPETVAAALQHFKRRPSLGFSDCLILETARKAGYLPLGTFDRSLAKLEGTQRP